MQVVALDIFALPIRASDRVPSPAVMRSLDTITTEQGLSPVQICLVFPSQSNLAPSKWDILQTTELQSKSVPF